MIEESRTNRLPDSEDFSSFNPNYSSARSTIASTTELAPDGTNTATKLVRTSGQGTGEVALLISGISGVTSGNTYTSSLFVKHLSGSNSSVVSFNNVDSSSGESDSEFNLLTGAIVTEGNQHTTSIIPYANGWYRIILSNRTASTNGAYFWIRSYNQQEGSGGFLLWGAQVEEGAFATSYIPTSGSTVTRAADLAKITGTNFSSWFNNTEGTIDVSYKFGLDTTANRVFQIGKSTTNNDFLDIVSASGGGTGGYFYVNYGGVNQGGGPGVTNSAHTNSIFKVVAAYKENDVQAVSNKTTTVFTDTTVNIPSGLDELYFCQYNGGDQLNGHLQTAKYYPKRLPLAQLRGLVQE